MRNTGEVKDIGLEEAAKGRRLPPGWRIYAIGDIHGRLDLLETLLATVYDDITARPCPTPLLVFLGDYIDRGAESAGVLDRLVELREIWPVQCLTGNHEGYLLRFLEDPGFYPDWIAVGGRETIRSYGLEAPSRPSSRDLARLRGDLAETTRRHAAFLSSLTSSFSIGDYFFCHAGVRPGVPLAWQTPDDLVMIREPFLSHGEDFGKLIVHGHTVSETPTVQVNRIGIDTGAYMTARLTCLVAETELLRFL